MYATSSTWLVYLSLTHEIYLGDIQKCQHFHECTNSTLFQTPSPSRLSVQTNIFGFQNMGFIYNIYYATIKINPSFKPIWNDSFG